MLCSFIFIAPIDSTLCITEHTLPLPPSPLFFSVSPHNDTWRPQLVSQQPACVRACWSILDDGLSMALLLTRHVCKCISTARLDPLNAKLQQTWPSIDTAAFLMRRIGSCCLPVRAQCFQPSVWGAGGARQTPAQSGGRRWLVVVSGNSWQPDLIPPRRQEGKERSLWPSQRRSVKDLLFSAERGVSHIRSETTPLYKLYSHYPLLMLSDYICFNRSSIEMIIWVGLNLDYIWTNIHISERWDLTHWRNKESFTNIF